MIKPLLHATKFLPLEMTMIDVTNITSTHSSQITLYRYIFYRHHLYIKIPIFLFSPNFPVKIMYRLTKTFLLAVFNRNQ